MELQKLLILALLYILSKLMEYFRTNFRDLNIGSPLYMSPEGILDNVYGPKTDVWAFGIMIYELYHGKTPFSYCQTEE